MLEAADTSIITESSKRRSTFYVPLTTDVTEDTKKDDCINVNIEKDGMCLTGADISFSDKIYHPDLSAWSSLDDSINNTDSSINNERENKLKRYGIVLNASINIDDDNQCHQKYTSTPIRLMKSRSRQNILGVPEKATSPLKEKSKTLSYLSPANTFPPKYSIVLRSTPKISKSLNYSSDNGSKSQKTSSTPTSQFDIDKVQQSNPKKSLSFIRRAHSTKLSRSNSLLKSLTTKCVDQSTENVNVMITYLNTNKLESTLRAGNNIGLIHRTFFKHLEQKDEESAIHSGEYFIFNIHIRVNAFNVVH